MNLAIGQTIGKYTNRDFLGSGAFGSVYLMLDSLLNREVAVKFIENNNPTDFVAHFEAQTLHTCRNDRIVSVNSVDVVRDSAGRYFAAVDMEYISGGSAQGLIEDGHVSIRRAIKIAIDTLLALEHTHRQNILHRDVKPANIMLVGQRAKLSDFGLAKTAASSLSASGAGSPVYSAPEVINDNITTVKTDIFSVGMTLFQLANNVSNLGARITSLDPIRMGRVIPIVGYKPYFPRRLRLICNRACSVDPDKRFATAFAMRQALERLHVKEDWNQIESDVWQASIKGNSHTMTIETGKSYKMVYQVNGRRRHGNCATTKTENAASLLQQEWVYENTF